MRDDRLRRQALVATVTLAGVAVVLGCRATTPTTTTDASGATTTSVDASASTTSSSIPSGTTSSPTSPTAGGAGKKAPPAGKVCALVSPALLTRVFGASVPAGDDTTAGPIKSTCQWKRGQTEVFVEVGGSGNYTFLQKDPQASWEPYDGVGFPAVIDDTFKKDGRHVLVKLTTGTVEVFLRPNPVDGALLADLVHDVVTNAPDA